MDRRPQGRPDTHHHHMPRMRELDPLTGTVIRALKTTAIHYEHDQPGFFGPHRCEEDRAGSLTQAAGGSMAARWTPPLPARNSKLGYDYPHFRGR